MAKVKFPKRLKYYIDQAMDIDPSTPTCENCPHARAIKRRTGCTRVRVFGGRVSIIDDASQYRYYYSAPTYTHQFEVARDQDGSAAVKPGFAIINFLFKNKVVPSDRQEQVNENRRKRAVMLRAKGEPTQPYRVRTGIAPGTTAA